MLFARYFTPLAQPANLEAEDTLPVSAAASIRVWGAASIRAPLVDDRDVFWWSYEESVSASGSESATP